MARACLLAAGRGRRAGAPKAWLELGGKSLLERQLDFLTARFAPSGVSISIQPEWLERCRALSPQANWVTVDPDASALASLQTLLLHDDWNFVHHVDMPVWEPGLFDLLEQKSRTSAADALAPAYQGRKGHPILISPRAIPLIKSLDSVKDRLDAWLRGRAVDVVEGSWPCVLENWNSGVPA